MNISASLTHYAHCGMVVPILKDESICNARRVAASILRDRRVSGFSTSIIEKGHEWEFTEPECSFMVPDSAGLMVLEVAYDELRDNSGVEQGSSGESC